MQSRMNAKAIEKHDLTMMSYRANARSGEKVPFLCNSLVDEL